eukprot:1902691-Ditylum_brightwellii.AAC.1
MCYLFPTRGKRAEGWCCVGLGGGVSRDLVFGSVSVVMVMAANGREVAGGFGAVGLVADVNCRIAEETAGEGLIGNRVDMM